jgi:hypothetical protein
MNYLHSELVRGVPRPGTARRSTDVDGPYPAVAAILARKQRRSRIRQRSPCFPSINFVGQ